MHVLSTSWLWLVVSRPHEVADISTSQDDLPHLKDAVNIQRALPPGPQEQKIKHMDDKFCDNPSDWSIHFRFFRRQQRKDGLVPDIV